MCYVKTKDKKINFIINKNETKPTKQLSVK